MRNLITGVLALSFVAAANAQLAVTEIWAGGIAGDEATSDWVEITNLGGQAAPTAGWYYDDDSADPTKDDPVLGLGSIAAGESVIVLISWEDDWNSFADAELAFTTQWDVNGSLNGVQIGYVDGGSGLGSGGDGAFFFDGNQAGANTVVSQTYVGPTDVASFVSLGDGSWTNQLAQVGVLDAYASNNPATNAPNIGPAIGSPGILPEPTSLVLLSAALLAVRRR